MKRRDFLLGSSAFAGSALSGCSRSSIPFNWFHRNPAPALLPTTCCLLIDASGSVTRKRDEYVQDFQCLVSHALDGTRFVVNFITDDPVTDARHLLNEELPPFDPVWDNKRRHDKAIKAAREALIEKFPRIFRNAPVGKSTPIIDSLRIPERIYQHYPKTRKRLVIFSDMLETKRVYLKKNMPPPSASKIIAALRSENTLPDISKAEIIVVGAIGSSAIENFWRSFFKQLDAEVIEYGAGLIDCPRA